MNGQVIEEKYLLHGILCLATGHELLCAKKQQENAEKAKLATTLEKTCARLPLFYNHHLLHWCAEIGNSSLFNFLLNYRDARSNLAANSERSHSMLYS